MKITDRFGNGELATVFIAENREGQQIEFVESIQPPFPAEKKWVNIISTLYGCPVNCKICDAGSNYQGKLSVEELLFQIDYLINYKFPDLQIPAEKWKIQFARMGEPAYNLNVIEVLKLLPVK
ncbi:radical SAM protein, partial [bacterium]|nr:radical SAM protein [bacterium]